MKLPFLRFLGKKDKPYNHQLGGLDVGHQFLKTRVETKRTAIWLFKNEPDTPAHT